MIAPLRTLRGRLVGAMLATLLLAVGVSAALDRMAGGAPSSEDEPYQDAVVLAGFSLPALALIWLIASWSLHPLARVSQQARRVGPRNPAARLSENGLPAEIVPLVQAVNGALDRMTDAVAAERRFTENAAHELRTPLAVLSLRLQRAKQEAPGHPGLDWAEIDRDLAQMNRLVSQLLDLARKENAGRTQGLAEAPAINLARIVREAGAMVLPMAEAQGRRLDIDVPDDLSTRGSADDLRDAISNVLENAVLHGKGRVAVVGRADSITVLLSITDEGPGIASGQQLAVFDRFQKGPASQGTGLGLAIVREVVTSHGGEVAFQPGSICQVTLRLPTAR